MRTTDVAAFLALVSGRRGHFELESGHHGGLWLDLDPLFLEPARVAPFVERLAGVLARHRPSLICGPLLGGAFLAQLVARELDLRFCFTERVMPAECDGLYRASYRLPHAFAPHVRGARIAIVDDVMSAGSASRGTFAELDAHGAVTVAAGALLVLGDAGSSWFAERGVPVEACARDAYDLWEPATCPRCAEGMPLERVFAGA
ncbi:MAG: orotate phosphoribosyltransferase [bacterium]